MRADGGAACACTLMTARPGFEPDRWVDDHGDVLFRYAMPRVRDTAVAEELVQETFLAALQARGSFGGRSSERTWLVGILKHKIVDHFRRTSRERPASDDDFVPSAIADLYDENRYWHHDDGPTDWGPGPAEALERAEFVAQLDDCLGELPTRLAAAFTLREVEELTSEEICKVLGVTTTNLWVMLHRARAHLRRCLELHWSGTRA
jgi:RNA polymerase sigma-70 factor (ECF subfamily)